MGVIDDYSKKTVPFPVAPMVAPVSTPGDPTYLPSTYANPIEPMTGPNPQSTLSKVGSFIASPDFQVATGNIAQAVMGPHQDSWQANMGRTAVEDVKKRQFSSAVAKAVAGHPLTVVDLKHLDAEQVLAAQKAGQDAGNSAFDREERKIKLEQDWKKLGYTEEEIKLKREELNQQDKQYYASLQNAKEIAQGRNATDIKTTQMQVGASLQAMRERIAAEFGTVNEQQFNRASALANQDMEQWVRGRGTSGYEPEEFDQAYNAFFSKYYNHSTTSISTGEQKTGSLSWQQYNH